VTASSLTERYSRVGWAIADQLLVSGTSFATTLLVARFLGKEQFGRFVLAWLGAWIVQNIHIALITTPITTFGMREPRERQAAYFGAVAIQQMVFAVVTAVLVFGVAKISGRFVPLWQLDQVAGPLALVVMFGQTADILRRYFYIHERIPVSFALDLARFGSQLLGLLVLFVVFPATASLATVFEIIAASSVLGVCVGLAFMKPLAFELAVIKDVALRHWTFSRWLLGSTLIYCAREGLVSVLVGSMLGLTEIGILRAVQQLVMTINIPLYVMHNTVPAAASIAYGQEGFTGLLSYMKGFSLKYFCFLCSVLLAIGVFGDPLLSTIYGQAFSGHGGLVLGSALIMIVFLIRDFLSIMVKAMEKTDFDFYASVVGAILYFVLLFPLVKRFGLQGALVTEALMHLSMLAVVIYGLKSHWHAPQR
jgi:O-antigen/teichoic acid export membrane protein